MSDQSSVDPVDYGLNFYPAEFTTVISQSTASSGLLRDIMRKMLETAHARSYDTIDDFKAYFETYNFSTPEAKESFFTTCESLSSVAKIDKWTAISEADLRQIGNNWLETLPSDHWYVMMSQSISGINFSAKPVNVVDLCLHMLYTSRVFMPLCNPAIAYAANLDIQLHGRFSAMLAAMATHGGRDALVPYILYTEWHFGCLQNLALQTQPLIADIKKKEIEVNQLKSDIVGLKAQSSTSSAYSWEV